MWRHRQKRTLIGILIGICVASVLGAGIFAIIRSQPTHPLPTVNNKIDLGLQEFDPSSPIARENLRPGSDAWKFDQHASLTFIQGYAGMVSAVAGMQVPLYISAESPVTYHLEVYRIGWYQGLGGALYYRSPQLKSLVQGNWTGWDSLNHCPTCTINPTTHLIETHWKSSFSLPIASNWISGVYLIKIIASNHAEGEIPLIIRAPTYPSAVLANVSVSTYQAYNLWGGFSLYHSDKKEVALGLNTRAYAVSFNRPYDRSGGAGDLLAWDIHLIRWMERSDLDVSYTTDVDISEQPQTLLQHRVVFTMAHDEYWTKAIRDGMEVARNDGVSLGFFGGNTAFWQNRFQPDDTGHPDRVMVCYKVGGANLPDAKRDPLFGKDNAEVTSTWRDPIVNRPESELLGLLYLSLTPANVRPDWVVSSTLDPFEAEAGLQPSQHIAGGLVGYEYDSLGFPQYTPKNLHILAASPLINTYGKPQIAMSAYYYASSGALVFDAGTIWWADGLDAGTPPDAYQANFLNGNQEISALTHVLIAAMLKASPVAPLKI